MYDIFISYRSTKWDWVETLALNLQDQGYSIFLDRWSLVPGQNFPGQISKSLKSAKCAILVASPDACDSGWVQDEHELMINLKNSDSDFFFIPIVMGEFPDLPFLETTQAIDFGRSDPETYRQAFQRLLHGLKQEPPGPHPYFSGSLQLPEMDQDHSRPLMQSEQGFLQEVFAKLSFQLPVMVLAQADTNTQIYGQALRKKAQTLYGSEQVYHVFPPVSHQAESADYFGRLAKQCRFEEDISTGWHWGDALSQKLESGQDIFLLVTGFENGPEASRREFCGELRQLYERFPCLHIVMFGGKSLAALKYANGDMSLLNIVQELPIPLLSHQDLNQLFGHLYPDLKLAPEQLESIFRFTGCHPRLLQFCLQNNADSAAACEQLLRESPLPTQLFTQFRGKQERPVLCQLLNQTKLGRFDFWHSEALLRELYWANLITNRGQHFVWRCEFIRETGQEVLQC